MAINTGDFLKHAKTRLLCTPPRWFSTVPSDLLIPVVSCAWMLLACVWLVLEPRFSLLIPTLELAFAWLPIAVSVALIAMVTIDAFGQLLRHGNHRVVLGDVLFLLMLFTIVFMQLSTHSDALHFAHDFVAAPFDWLLFSLGNALRAADLADTMKDYGVYVPQITAQSWFACFLLVAYRLIIDILFLSYALLTVKRIGKWITEALADVASSVIQLHVLYFLCCVTFLACWFFTAFWWSPWLLWDQICWPIDNVVRVIDVFDAMQIFGLRFDSVPNGRWEITLGIMLRVLVAIALTGPVDVLQGRSADFIRTKLLRSKTDLAPTREDLTEARWDLRFAFASIAVFAIGMALVTSFSGATHRRLVSDAVGEHDIQSHEIIRRLGINCAPNAMHALHQVAVDQSHDDQQRLRAISTLGYFGSESVDLLVDSLRQNRTLSTDILESLMHVGPSSSAAMVSVLEESDPQMRQRAFEQLQAWAGDSVSYLAPKVDRNNATYFYTLFDEIDPYWDRRRGSGRWFKHLVDAKRSSQWLRPAVNKLFASKSTIQANRIRGESIQRIVAEMTWASPAVAEELIRVEVFLNSKNYWDMRHVWEVNSRKSRSPGAGRYPVGAAFETDGARQARQHLTAAMKRSPEAGIDVFLKHRHSDNALYVDAAAACLQGVCGSDYVKTIREHRERGIQGRAFQVEALEFARNWSPPDIRQIIIDSGLTRDATSLVPVCPREQLSPTDANDIIHLLSDREFSVWKDVLNELQSGDYPKPFFQAFAVGAMEHPSTTVRQEFTVLYPKLIDADKLMSKHLARETNEDVVVAIINIAKTSRHLREVIWSPHNGLTETSSEAVANSVADLLTMEIPNPANEGDLDEKVGVTPVNAGHLLGACAAKNPLYRKQLLDRIDAISSFDFVAEFYRETIRETPLTPDQIEKLFRVLDRGVWEDELQLLAELTENQTADGKRLFVARILGNGPAGRATFFQNLENQNDPETIELYFQSLGEWLKQTYPASFRSDIIAEAAANSEGPALAAPPELTAQVLQTTAMSHPLIRRRGLELLGEFDTKSRQSVLTDLYGRLETEPTVEVRRAIIDFLVGVRPNGIKGVVAWRSQETNPELIQYLDTLIVQNNEEIARLSVEKQQRIEAEIERVDELVAELRNAESADAISLQEELSRYGKLSFRPVARLLYEPDFDNRYAINAGFDVLRTADGSSLPMLEVLAKAPNELVWRKAVDAISESGSSSESYLRRLLEERRPELISAVFRKLSKFDSLENETLLAVAIMLTIEEANIDKTAYAILKRHPASRALLEKASQSPRIRDTLRQAIQQDLERN